MSLYDYEKSKEISKGDPSFASLIMAAIRKADTNNTFILGNAFPEIFAELTKRYNSPSGLLDGDQITVEIDGKKYQKIFRKGGLKWLFGNISFGQ